MKKYLTLGFFMLMVISSKAQILHPVTWSYAAKRLTQNEAVLFIKATIEPGWHIYSQYVKDGGPVKTSFVFNKSDDFSLMGKTIEPKPISRLEKVFNMEVGFFETSVIFQQKIMLKKKSATVHGTLEFMTCNDQKCLPPEDVEFNISIN